MLNWSMNPVFILEYVSDEREWRENEMLNVPFLFYFQRGKWPVLLVTITADGQQSFLKSDKLAQNGSSSSPESLRKIQKVCKAV